LILFERTIQEQFWLLIPTIASILIISRIKRSNPIIVKAVILAHFSKAQFKQIESNKTEQNFISLYWVCIFFHGLFLHSAFLLDYKYAYLIYLSVGLIVLAKRITLSLSSWLFEQNEIFKKYITSHQITVIIQGLIILPAAILNIIYQDKMAMVNKAVLILVFLFIFYKILYYVFEARGHNVSYFHLFSYICTLEILPWVLITVLV
jgi:hypothetical protein